MANGKAGAPFGNKNNVTGRLFSDAIRKEAVQNPEKLRKIVKALFDRAGEGDIQAAREIGDRLEGKALATVDITHREGESMSETQARMMAEEYIARAAVTGTKSVGSDEPAGVHDSAAPGLPSG